MRKTDIFGINIPELGDPSDITVVSDAITAVENSTGCKIEFMDAIYSGNTISLSCKTRTNTYIEYYNGMAIAFVAPTDIQEGKSISIKIDNLPQQPFNNIAFAKSGSLVFIKYNTSGGFTSVINGSKVINNLTSGGVNSPLSAEMGRQLQNNKVSKTGDIMTGSLAIKTNTWSEIQFNDSDNKRIGTVGSDIALKKTFLHDYESQSGVDIYTDGRMEIFAKNLITPSKEGIAAINDIYSILQKNSGLDFDQNLLYLNDSGTKMQGKIYFDRLAQGMFECIQTTTTTVNDTTYFKNISNKENSARLSNLVEFKIKDFVLGNKRIYPKEISYEGNFDIGKVITAICIDDVGDCSSESVFIKDNRIIVSATRFSNADISPSSITVRVIYV